MSADDVVTMTRAEYENLLMGYERADAFGGWIAATVQLGHSTPASTIGYMHGVEPGSPQAFVRDFVAWTAARQSAVPGCEDRLREWGQKEAGLRLAHIFPGERAS